jgi:hypothetical protein
MYFIPEPARPLLRAARTFLQLPGADPSKRLLTGGIGPNAAYLAASAVHCQQCQSVRKSHLGTGRA